MFSTENDALCSVLFLYLPCGIGTTTNQPLVSGVSSWQRGVCAGMPHTHGDALAHFHTCTRAAVPACHALPAHTPLVHVCVVVVVVCGHLTQLASGMGFGYGNDCVWDFVVKSRHSTWNPTHFTTNPTTSPHPNRILARPPAPRRERARHVGASFVWRGGCHFGVISI